MIRVKVKIKNILNEIVPISIKKFLLDDQRIEVIAANQEITNSTTLKFPIDSFKLNLLSKSFHRNAINNYIL